MNVPLNALRAFEASARHLSFTRAAQELHLSQASVSQHVKRLEKRLGVSLFRRVPRGLALTDEGIALLPVMSESFERIRTALDGFDGRRRVEPVSLGVVGSIAAGWLLPRLPAFRAHHPYIELRLFSNNNRVDLAAEGLDCAIRFGDGRWSGVDAVPLLDAPLTPVCAPDMLARLDAPERLARETLLRSYRRDEWPAWFRAAGMKAPALTGSVFDSSHVLADFAEGGAGVALLPVRLFEQRVRAGRLVRPFDLEIDVGRYWLTRMTTRRRSEAVRAVEAWLLREAKR